MALAEAANLNLNLVTTNQETKEKTQRLLENLRHLTLESRIEILEDILVAQVQAIDNLMPRLVILDKTYDPVQHLNWPLVQEGRREAAIILKERPNAGTIEGEPGIVAERKVG